MTNEAPSKSSSGGGKATSSSGGGKVSSSNATSSAKPSSKGGIPAGINKEEIKDPDTQQNLWSVYYCQKMYEKYQEVSETLSGNDQQIASFKYNMYLTRYHALVGAIESGQVDQDQYLGYLDKALAHDKILLKYFIDTKNQSKAGIVKYRMEWIQKEKSGDITEEEDSD